jgi:hypothetical protein
MQKVRQSQVFSSRALSVGLIDVMILFLAAALCNVIVSQ